MRDERGYYYYYYYGSRGNLPYGSLGRVTKGVNDFSNLKILNRRTANRIVERTTTVVGTSNG